MNTWTALLLAAAGCYAIKLLGLTVPERVLRHPALRSTAGLLPIALLASLTAVQTLSDGPELVLDADAPALAAAGVALWLRAPFLVVLLVAAATSALLRSL
ncbi:AzlD domain-containing protein [Allostreptomyces psammosilenae]|uniref:Putative membrane protein n=1 Tax=Allostreptomyces psammosilenae TaxID=1892865 RepID=A0A852ZXQ7_9ACTN|nr:AzlD domain-containing protein [Allostreptomyces psammosilenae]NYI03072.1 putative membrane protein [Allostreptomyces psammosilenae]